MEMRNERVLIIGGEPLLLGLNHRIRHVAAYFEQRLKAMDVVGFIKFYGGLPAPPWTKARKGISNLLNSRITISEEGGIRRIAIRDPYVPRAIEMPIKDLWRYINLCQIIKQPYDLAIFGYPGNAWLASLLKKSGRVRRLIYDDWDYHPGFEKGLIGRQMVERRERLCARCSDAVISVNELLAQLRLKQGAKQAFVVPNGMNLSLFAKARQKVPHPPTLVYTGTLSPLWGVDVAIKAMAELLRNIPDVRLMIAGYGPAEPDLRALSQRLNVADRVNFLGVFKYQELPTILAQADVGILPASPKSTFRYYASPLKLIEYMAAGLPVIATRLGQTEITMQEADAGILINHSVEEFVAAAVSLLRDKALYERYSHAAINYAESFDWNLLMEKAYQYALQVMEEKSETGR
jgi:glycosyltransferase involved in cell wall biosynthesis